MKIKEEVIRNAADMSDGEMKIVHVDDHDLLLIKRGNEYYVMGAHCPHYGAPLDQGILNGDRLVCPWHHSCFNIKTGALEEPPSLHSLNRPEVRLQGKDLVIRIPEGFSENILPKMASRDLVSDNRNFIIIGAGAAGTSAAQALREAGYKGNIIMITPEEDYPYDRPNLSKAYMSGQAPDEWMPLHTPKFYSIYNIDVRFNEKVTDLNKADKNVVLASGERLDYDKLLIATGAVPEKPAVQGSDLKNIFTLRSYQSCREILTAADKAQNIVVIGSGFIGTETAFSLAERTKKKIHLISRHKALLEKAFGEEIGALMLRKHQEHGTIVHTAVEVEEFTGDDQVEGIRLSDGSFIPADLVLIGYGVTPATDFLQDFDLLPDRSVEVDRNFKAFDSVFAAGDAATFIDWRNNKPIRIEHWRTAQQHGRTAALNMLGIKTEYTAIPFFWTKQAGLNIRYVGYTDKWDEIFYDGEVSSESFIAYYIREGRILAAAGNKRDKDMAALSELMRSNMLPSVNELKARRFIPSEVLSKKIYA